MSPRSPPEQLADLRDDARLLIERTGDQQVQLEALVASAEWDVTQAEAALSEATDVDEVRHLLSAQLHRSEAGAATARLCGSARQQHAAARQLLAHLGDVHGPVPQRPNAVLVVDDSGDVRDVLAGVLEDAGFVVRTAANGSPRPLGPTPFAALTRSSSLDEPRRTSGAL